MRVRTSITIPEELQERAEQFAEETKRTFSAVCELALEAYLGDPVESECEEREDGREQGPDLSA